MESAFETSETPEPTGRAITLGATDGVAPGGCACCGDAASSSRLESGPRGSLIVPYCARCLRHASARNTRVLAALVASALLAVTAAFALPLAWPWVPLVVHVMVTLVVSCVPIAIRFVAPKRRLPGHSASERAVWWQADGTLACTNARWAEALVKSASGSELSPLAPREPRFSPWFVAGPLVALFGGTTSWLMHHPIVRVLNLTDSRIEVVVDGRAELSVEPTSSESPSAGVEVRWPTGEHQLQARSAEGAVVSDARGMLESGSRHLYAPGSRGYCFWLEETRYGRAGAQAPRLEALPADRELWVLPPGIDTWFSENPAPAAADARSSGGVLLALRQSRCRQAPPAVQQGH